MIAIEDCKLLFSKLEDKKLCKTWYIGDFKERIIQTNFVLFSIQACKEISDIFAHVALFSEQLFVLKFF